MFLFLLVLISFFFFRRVQKSNVSRYSCSLYSYFYYHYLFSLFHGTDDNCCYLCLFSDDIKAEKKCVICLSSYNLFFLKFLSFFKHFSFVPINCFVVNSRTESSPCHTLISTKKKKKKLSKEVFLFFYHFHFYLSLSILCQQKK